MAHLIDDGGVTEVPFARTGPKTYTNSEAFTMQPGSVLGLGGGLTLCYPPSPPQIVAREVRPEG